MGRKARWNGEELMIASSGSSRVAIFGRGKGGTRGDDDREALVCSGLSKAPELGVKGIKRLPATVACRQW